MNDLYFYVHIELEPEEEPLDEEELELKKDEIEDDSFLVILSTIEIPFFDAFIDDIIIFIIQNTNHAAKAYIAPFLTLGSVEVAAIMIPIDDKEQNIEVMFPVMF